MRPVPAGANCPASPSHSDTLGDSNWIEGTEQSGRGWEIKNPLCLLGRWPNEGTLKGPVNHLKVLHHNKQSRTGLGNEVSHISYFKQN